MIDLRMVTLQTRSCSYTGLSPMGRRVQASDDDDDDDDSDYDDDDSDGDDRSQSSKKEITA